MKEWGYRFGYSKKFYLIFALDFLHLNDLQEIFVKNGGEIRSGEKMTGLFPGEIITVKTTKRSYKTRSVIICAGPWAPELLKPLGLHLPLKVCVP